MYFCQKLFSMKKAILYTLLFFAILAVSSCGIYEKPCEGVTTTQQQTPNS